jgi:hypothetical protein
VPEPSSLGPLDVMSPQKVPCCAQYVSRGLECSMASSAKMHANQCVTSTTASGTGDTVTEMRGGGEEEERRRRMRGG